MGHAFKIYNELIEAAGAQVVDFGPGAKFETEQPESHEEAAAKYRGEKLVYLEFWHDGGVSGKGLGNQLVIAALKKLGWSGMPTPKSKTVDGDLYLYKQGDLTGKPFGVHRAGSDEPGFNLVAPVVFLPASDSSPSLAEARSSLARILSDLAELRAEIGRVVELARTEDKMKRGGDAVEVVFDIRSPQMKEQIEQSLKRSKKGLSFSYDFWEDLYVAGGGQAWGTETVTLDFKKLPRGTWKITFDDQGNGRQIHRIRFNDEKPIYWTWVRGRGHSTGAPYAPAFEGSEMVVKKRGNHP